MRGSNFIKYLFILPIAITFTSCEKYEIDEKKINKTFAPTQLQQPDIQVDATQTGGISIIAPQFDLIINSIEISKSTASTIEGATIANGSLHMEGENPWPLHFALPHGATPSQVFTDYKTLPGGNSLSLTGKCKTNECHVYYLSVIVIAVDNQGYFSETRQYVFRKESGNPQIFVYPVSINNNLSIEELEVTLDAMATGKL